YMQHKLYDHVDTKRMNTFLPNGLAEDLDAECITYEKHIQEAGNLDFLVLGIGENGHIGFNEPGTSFESRTHIVTLTENTREVNARFFDSIDEVPTEALTMGLGTIMDAKQIILLVDRKSTRLNSSHFFPTRRSSDLDFLVLGIGENGHIGFNEPGTSFESRTHIVTLTENTREVNARFFDSIDEVPTEALTMGLGTIMDAKQIMLL